MEDGNRGTVPSITTPPSNAWDCNSTLSSVFWVMFFHPFKLSVVTPLPHPFLCSPFFGKMLLLASAVGETETGAEAHKETNQWLAER